MPFDRGERSALLNQRADVYIETALDAITREYPYMPYLIVTGPGPIPTHRELHPTFYGSFDWHSCVEMHWAIIRLLRRFPASESATTPTPRLASPAATTSRIFGLHREIAPSSTRSKRRLHAGSVPTRTTQRTTSRRAPTFSPRRSPEPS